MGPDVARAVEEVRLAYPGNAVTATPDGDGGAWVVVEGLPLGDTYCVPSTWVGFRIAFQYPYADVYPHFVRADLARANGMPLGDGMTPGVFPFDARQAIQISRRSNRW